MPPADPAPELEDDVAELILDLAYESIVGHGATEAARQQFRDALVKLIDRRVDDSLRNR